MPTSMIAQRDILLDQARAIAQRAKDANRNLTAAEMDAINRKMTDVHDLDGQIKSAAESDALFNQIMALPPDGRHPDGDGEESGTRYLDLSPTRRKSIGTHAAQTMTGWHEGRKSVMPNGEPFLPPVLTPTDPVVEGRAAAATTLLELIPVTQIPAGATAKYYRQTTRVNNFAPVFEGDLKPQNDYGLTGIDVKLSIYAGLSEPQGRFALGDAEQLVTFIVDELAWGLRTRVEADVIAGNPAVNAPGMKGILQTSGVRTQAFVGDILQTTRTALVGNQKLGYGRPDTLVYVLSPEDWSAAQLLQASGSGNYLMPGAPNQDTAQTLWGFPVAISTGLPVKTGLLLDRTQLALYTDQAIKIDTGTPNDMFQRNQVQFRCEGRYDLAVLMPAAHVVIATATTP